MKTLLITLLTLLSVAGFAQTVTNATVTWVYDVDTYHVRRDSDGKVISIRPYHMRGAEVYNPHVGNNKAQTYADTARDKMKALLTGKRVFVRTTGVRSYKRYMGFVWLADGTRLDSLSIASGLVGYGALPRDTPAEFTKFRLVNGPQIEAKARAEKVGRYRSGKRVFNGRG